MTAIHLAILLLFPVVAYGQVTLRPSNEMSLELFQDIDRNGNLQVTGEEVELYFRDYDYDGDGYISAPEFSQHIFTHYQDLTAYDTSLYKFFDFNNDGHLNHPDFDNLFTQMDCNANGSVNQTEFSRYFNVIFDSLGKRL